jgi:two-component system, NtrC family, sensor kinase
LDPIARGDFHHRIRLDTHDEMSELADAMNDMTERFQEIRDDLDRQVRSGPRRSFAASSWPASAFWRRAWLTKSTIRWRRSPVCRVACAPHARRRSTPRLRQMQEVGRQLPEDDPGRGVSLQGNHRTAARLFANGRRAASADRSPELVEGVIEMVGHLGKYQEKQVVFRLTRIMCPGQRQPQEIKQVVLNLITNGLDSLDPEAATCGRPLRERGGRRN